MDDISRVERELSNRICRLESALNEMKSDRNLVLMMLSITLWAFVLIKSLK